MKILLLIATIFLLLPSFSAAVAADPYAALPKLDRSTPASQDGFRFEGISRANAYGQLQYPVPPSQPYLSGPSANGAPGAFGIWFTASPKLFPRPIKGRFMPMIAPISVQEKPEQGMAFSINVMPVNQMTNIQNGQPPTLYVAEVPAGYPVPYGAIDVIATGPGFHHARWRLADLPPSIRAIAPNAPIHAFYRGNGFNLQAKAWIGPLPYFGGPQGSAQPIGILYAINGSCPLGQGWMTTVQQAHSNWEPYVPPAPGMRMQNGFGGMSSMTNGPIIGMQGYVQNPYATQKDKLSLAGNITQLAFLNEQATFHNLILRKLPPPPNYPKNAYIPASYAVFCKPQTVHTPSGISITLLPWKNQPMGYGGNGIFALMKFEGAIPNRGMVNLPHSPLAKKYHHPIQLSLQGGGMFESFNLMPIYSPGGYMVPRVQSTEFIVQIFYNAPMHMKTEKINGHTIIMGVPGSLPQTIPEFTLNLWQQTNVRSLPFHFLIPIGAAPPAPRYPMFSRPFPGGHPPFPPRHLPIRFQSRKP